MLRTPDARMLSAPENRSSSCASSTRAAAPLTVTSSARRRDTSRRPVERGDWRSAAL